MRVLILFLLFQSTPPPGNPAQVEGQHGRPPAAGTLTLAQIEATVLENNPEIRLMKERVALAKAGIGLATSIDRPRQTPLREPGNLNQTQQLFLLSQTFPAAGKRELDRLFRLLRPGCRPELARNARHDRFDSQRFRARGRDSRGVGTLPAG